jgi:cytochrome c-type biogenesis protein CcmH/NrfF
MHMGAMHPYEQLLTLVLAVGPFLVLGLVVLVRRRADEREAAEAAEAAQTVPLTEAPEVAPVEGHLDR